MTNGTAFATADGRIGLGTTSPTRTLDVRGSVAVEGSLLLKGPERGVVCYDQETSSLIVGEATDGIDQEVSEDISSPAIGASAWQSFTAGVSGDLYRIEVMLRPQWSVHTFLREGEVDTGPVMASGPIPNTAGGPVDWYAFEISPPIRGSAGSKYTIHLILEYDASSLG